MKITIESEALDSLKAMAQRLQDERDELLNVLHNVKAFAGNPESVWRIANEAINKCTAKPEVLA